MTDTAKVFMSGRSKAVRLPLAYRVDTDEVFIRRDEATGDIILSVRPKDWTGFFALLEKADSETNFMAYRDQAPFIRLPPDTSAPVRTPLASWPAMLPTAPPMNAAPTVAARVATDVTVAPVNTEIARAGEAVGVRNRLPQAGIAPELQGNGFQRFAVAGDGVSVRCRRRVGGRHGGVVEVDIRVFKVAARGNAVAVAVVLVLHPAAVFLLLFLLVQPVQTGVVFR